LIGLAEAKTHNIDAGLPLVIVNPKSASGSTRERWAQTASDLRVHFGPFGVAFTKRPGDGAEIAERAATAGRRLIIACGGDGTVNEVANGILRSGGDTELGVLPSGTGGDFRRTLGMPPPTREAAAALRDGETQRIDVGRVRFHDLEGEPAERYFLNVSSFGLAASVIKRVKSARAFDWMPGHAIRGKANFAVSTLQEIFGLDAVNIRVRFDDGWEKTLRTVNFCIANARYFGGGMMIAPEAKLNDGLLDVVNIGDLSTARILLKGHTLYRGTLNDLPEVKTMLARKIEASAADDTEQILIETDGELPGRLPATYEVVPSALNVRIPQRP
jgi:YegS/Rv2252/BmrU family lipid kinase